MIDRTRPDGDATDVVVLRPAGQGDVDAVTAIERTAFSDPWSRASFAALVANPAVLFLLACGAAAGTREATVLGYVVIWFAADESEIGTIAVAADARGRGIGATLLDAALAAARDRGAAMTYLEVRESNAPARQLYASRGFTQLGRRRKYYDHPREDALVLGRPTGDAPA